MPILTSSSYQKRPFYLFNGHLETVLPSLFRKVKGVDYQRERLELNDGDFLDLDWVKQQSNKLLILSHGLEGSSDRHYVKGVARFFAQQGWDILAWNYRSCSGEMNRLPRMYHHGVTDDLERVIQRGLEGNYTSIGLVGFSMGGSTTLKYLGELGKQVSHHIKAATVFSVPCNLWDSAIQLTKKENEFYKNRFLKKLKRKIEAKAKDHSSINIDGLKGIKHFNEFDDRYTAPLHGFKNAKDFYVSSTSDQFYHNIEVPALIVNAKNDPLLGDKCYPYELADSNPNLYLETPELGGHVGFTSVWGKSYMEERAFEFISQYA